eukprot:jgi/Botrbrau1/6287/Bobra.0129s0031.2
MQRSPRIWRRYLQMYRFDHAGKRMVLWMTLALDCLLRHAGPFFIALAIILILAVSFVYLLLIWPQLHYKRRSSWGPVLHLAYGVFLLFNILTNFFLCAFTSPGFTTPDMQVASSPSPMRFCKRCVLPKPHFAHHCHICERCVLRMDHHCPWFGACIGFANHRAFILFLLYLTLGCIYMVWVSVRLVAGSESLGDSVMAHSIALPALTFALALSGAIGLLLLPLLMWHLYLASTAQTTIDCFNNWHTARQLRSLGQRFENPYDLGIVRNLQDMFDVAGFWWWIAWLFPPFAPKRGDGYRFPTVFDLPSGPARPCGELRLSQREDANYAKSHV